MVKGNVVVVLAGAILCALGGTVQSADERKVIAEGDW